MFVSIPITVSPGRRSRDLRVSLDDLQIAEEDRLGFRAARADRLWALEGVETLRLRRACPNGTKLVLKEKALAGLICFSTTS
jgi:hypothetical protein